MIERMDFAGFGGVRLAADVFGHPEAPIVLLIPSGVQTREFWHGSARALADAGRRAICVDLRGHGDSGYSPDGHYDIDSYAADLRAILAALPSRAFVVAAGLGGLAAMVAVGEGAPDLVSGLALVDVNIWFDETILERRRQELLRRIGEQDGADAAAGPDRLEPGAPDWLAACYDRDNRKVAWRGDPRTLERTDSLLDRSRLETAVSRIATPVALIRGNLHDTISGETIRAIQALIKGSEVAEIEGAGNYLAADTEDAFNSILLEFLERKAPRKPVGYVGGSEPRMLRDALGCFGTGVTVITTSTEATGPIGLTANSFTSVSLDPPLILFSLAKSSANLPAFVEAGKFAVNVLHIGQQPVAGRFAQRVGDRFEGVDWKVLAEGGSPVLLGSLASFDCHTYAVHEGGDHLVFIGEVKNAWFEPHRDPLLYFRGRYRRLHFA